MKKHIIIQAMARWGVSALNTLDTVDSRLVEVKNLNDALHIVTMPHSVSLELGNAERGKTTKTG